MNGLSSAMLTRNLAGRPGYCALQAEVAGFLYLEADLLDNRLYDAWLELLDDDIVYFMPMRRNVPLDHKPDDENTVAGAGIHWFEDDKWTLAKRVEQIQTGIHYAEEPLSRIAHVIANVRIVDAEPDLQAAAAVWVTSRFLMHQNRIDYDTSTFVGRRHDRLVRHADTWRIQRREIILEQGILPQKNLSNFF
jgi:3-phenylpropionate/cinnamic acid dioxygenase small subunit